MTTALIVGTGAIGGFYGALLARQGVGVSVVCRSDYARVKEHGLTIDSCSLGQWRFRPLRVLKHADAFDGIPDYVILCTKVLENLNRVELIRGAVGKNTTIVFIQNGVEIEEEMRRAFPENEVISGLAFICCNRLPDGVISHQAYGRLTLGNLSGEVSANTERLCEIFSRSGIECQTSTDIVGARWQKCVWNAPFNPLSVLSGGLSTQAILDSQEPFVRSIMTEVFVIAAAAGHPLPEDVIETNIQNTKVMPPYKTSMLLDYEAGRPMETEAILGNAVKAARREKTDCPYLEAIYALMKLREESLKSVKDE
ncbi:MAG: ketopantoate reductase family protein [Gammaproteobacteria bacterium]